MVKIAEIIEQNPWWKGGSEFVRYDPVMQKAGPIFFERRGLKLKRGRIYIIRGPRQVGKTTYIKETIRKLIDQGVPPQNILYLSLDFFLSRKAMRNAIRYFIDITEDASEIFMFLDEITSIEGWNLELKYLADLGITRKGTIFATGSSAIKLKEKGELLPGRGLEGNEYYIKPLSFREFIIQSAGWIKEHSPSEEFRRTLPRLKKVLQENFVDLSDDFFTIKKKVSKLIPYKKEIGYFFRIYLMTGGLPGVVNHYLANRFKKRKEVIEPQLSEIFVRDVLGDLSKIQKQETITRQILRDIIDRYGSRYSFSELSREIERPHATTIDYIEYLEDSFISFVLYAYDFNKKRPKLKGDKKIYFFDPMIFHSISSYLKGKDVWNVIVGTMEDEELLSKLVEGVVISHILSHREIPFLKAGRTFLWYYYDKTGKEIDLIVKVNGVYLGIEVKYREQVGPRDIKKIDPVKKYLILSKRDVAISEDLLIIPVDVFLSMLKVSERNL